MALCTIPRLVTVLLLLGVPAATAQLLPPPEPAGNPVTAEKALLGKVLFWDEQLSSTRTVSCGTCHLPEVAGVDPRALESPLSVHPGPDGEFGGDDDILGSPGVPVTDAGGLYLGHPQFGLVEQPTHRRANSALNAGYSSTLFWDGRAGEEFRDPVTGDVVLASGAALESQAVGPVVSEVEMAHVGRVWSEAVSRLEESRPLAVAAAMPAELSTWIAGRSYPDLFVEAFGSSDITAARIGMAIATYERTLFTNQSPFDELLAGGDVLTPDEQAGRDVFVASSCDRCHSFERLTDDLFHYTGVRPPTDDPGRFEVTSDPDDLGRMKTPSLRNVELRDAFMHNGRFATLEDVVEFYNRGGDFDAPNKDPLVRALDLTDTEKSQLLAFLRRPLTDLRVAAGDPPFDRPVLYAESSRVPVVEGAGLPGSGGFEPVIVALEPPLLGNPSFTVAVDQGLGGAQAVLAIDSSDPGLTLPASAELAYELVTLAGSGDGAGFGSVSIALPDASGWIGREWFGRWYVTDIGGGGTHAVSPLVRFTTFPAFAEPTIFADGFESGDTSAWSSIQN